MAQTSTPPANATAPKAMVAKPAGGQRYAGFWIRLASWIIDYIILAIVAYVLFGTSGTSVSGASISVSYDGWRAIIPILYFILFWGFLSATPGKMVLKLKIVEEGGGKLSWGKAIIRFLGYIPSTIVLFIGFIWIGFDKEKRGWHDMIAKTRVIHK